MSKLHPVKIHIKNFQSIEDLEIEVFGFTCITGPSNIGKSAIVRATSSSILNNPVVGMVRKGESFCSVELNSEGWGFRWEKNDRGVNRVYIPPSKAAPLDKIGQTQVPAITEMGFGSIEVGDDEIQPWLAPQFQVKGCGPPFLLDQSGPRVTDFLSEVSRLTVLQDAITLAARGKRSSNDQAKAKNEEASQVRAKLLKVNGLELLEKLGKDLQDQATSIEEYEKKIAIGEALIAKRQEAERVIALLEKVDELRIPRDNCGELVQKVKTLYHLCFSLEACATRIRKLSDLPKVKIPDDLTEEIAKLREVQKFAKLETVRQSVKALEDLPKVKVPDIKKVKAEVEKVREIAKFATQISALQASVSLLDKQIDIPDEVEEIKKLQTLVGFAHQIQTLSEEIEDIEAQTEKIDKELAQVEEEIASIPSCPTCNRPMFPNHTGTHRKTL